MGPGAARTLSRAPAAVAAVLTALALAVPAARAALPREGLFVPGRSLAGVAVGMTRADVKRVWGTRFGRCRDCAAPTWYFTYRRFEPQGAGVSFRNGRVTHVFTLWQPAGWRTARGLALGAPEASVTSLYGTLARRRCHRYVAFVLPGERADSAFYVYDGEVWGFGLKRREGSPCL